MAVTHIKRTPVVYDEKSKLRFDSVSGLVIFLILVVALIFVMSVLFRIRVIDVVGNEHYTDNEIIEAVDIEDGDNLFFFDRFGAVARVFSKLPYVEEVSISRSLPNKVTITVAESKAMAYIVLGSETWTIDYNCKILGKAADGETASLIAVTGIKPGTLMIGEDMQTEDGDTELVEYLAALLWQISERGLAEKTRSIDFEDKNNVSFDYAGKFTVRLGASNNLEHKMGMFVSVLSQLKSGDNGTINLADGVTAHFSPM